jgi:ribosomal protein S3AE
MEKEEQKRKETFQEFRKLINMTPAQLKKWLDTEASRTVGFKNEGENESVGHQSGKRIIAILETKEADLTEDDYAHMRKVIGYIKRHKAQKPAGDVSETPWRYSLMNWGHDPLKESAGSY